MSTGAKSPEEITHAFVLNGMSWVWAMLEGEKVYDNDEFDALPVAIKSKTIENRHVRFSPGWYGVIFGKGMKGDTKENHQMCKLLLPEMNLPPLKWDGLEVLRGCVVGIVFISHSLPHESCKHSKWANGAPVCNIITKAGWLDTPIPCKGNLGACPIEAGETRNRVRMYAKNAVQDGNVFNTNGEVEHPYNPAVWDKKRKSKAAIDTNDPDEMHHLKAFLKNGQSKRLKTGSESSA